MFIYNTDNDVTSSSRRLQVCSAEYSEFSSVATSLGDKNWIRKWQLILLTKESIWMYLTWFMSFSIAVSPAQSVQLWSLLKLVSVIIFIEYRGLDNSSSEKMFLIFFTLPSMLLACGSREPTSMNTLLNLVIGGCVCVCSIDDSWLHPCSGDSSWSLCWMSCSSGGQSADCGLCCVSATGQWWPVFQDWCPGGELSISGMNSLARVL